MSLPPSPPGADHRRTLSQQSSRDEGSYRVNTGRPSIHDDLERQQTWNERTGSEGGDDENAFLSEVAAPPPLEWQETKHGRKEVQRGDNEERRLRRASESKEQDGEAFLSEVAAPPPVERPQDSDSDESP